MFPIDIPYKGSLGYKLLFRLDIKEFNETEENRVECIIDHILRSDEKNSLIFTFDLTSSKSFEGFLK